MLAWLLIAVALVALVFDPGIGARVIVAGAVLLYLIRKARSLGQESSEPLEGEDEDPGDGSSRSP